MDANIARLPAFESTASSWIHPVGVGIGIFGVFVIVARWPWRRELLLMSVARRTTKPIA